MKNAIYGRENYSLFFVDEANYHNKFIFTECCYSMLGSNVLQKLAKTAEIL